MTKNGVTGYVQPNDAGIPSTPENVGKRLGKLLDALDGSDTINRWIVGGPITEDLWQFKQTLMAKLQADGWEIKVGKSDHYRVKPSKKYWESLRPTHTEHAAKVGVAVPCTSVHQTFGGKCLNCGYTEVR